MPSYPIDAVIFDSDGVLVDSEILGVEVEMEALSKIGLTYAKPVFMQRFLGLADTDFMKALDIDARERLGVALPDDFLERLVTSKDSLFRRELRAVPGVKELLTTLPVPKAVASSASVWELNRNLELTGIFESFRPHIYSAELVEAGKPAPDIFLHAARQLDIPPERCLVIEDSPSGVRAGLAANMTVWGFIGGGHASDDLGNRLKAAGAHEIMKSHEEIGRTISRRSPV
jgi:HAD superfamily hydrolase (TIGR01509 family)